MKGVPLLSPPLLISVAFNASFSQARLIHSTLNHRHRSFLSFLSLACCTPGGHWGPLGPLGDTCDQLHAGAGHLPGNHLPLPPLRRQLVRGGHLETCWQAAPNTLGSSQIAGQVYLRIGCLASGAFGSLGSLVVTFSHTAHPQFFIVLLTLVCCLFYFIFVFVLIFNFNFCFVFQLGIPFMESVIHERRIARLIEKARPTDPNVPHPSQK